VKISARRETGGLFFRVRRYRNRLPFAHIYLSQQINLSFTKKGHSVLMTKQGFQDGMLPLFSPLGDEDEAPAVPLSHRLPSYIADHRKRLRSRFMEGGATAMPDYELLELLLFRTIPRQDVKPLVRLLLETFGDLNRVVTASPARLLQVKGVGEAVVQDLKILEAVAQRMMRARVMHKPVLSSWDALLDYCHTTMAHRETEQFRILFLDRKNTLIADEEQAQGTVDHVPVYPREVVKRALELNASALILVHNHPSGDPTPSQADISMTIQIQDACQVLSLTLHDHLIIGKERELSFRAQGYL
jgi:DNA repair protein RadC